MKAIKNGVKKQILEIDQKSITDLFSKDLFCEEAIYDFFKQIKKSTKNQ